MGPLLKRSRRRLHKPPESLLYVLLSCNVALFSREKPQDDEWVELKRHQVPLLLNYSQCKLSLHDYKPVIDHCTEVLDFEPGKLQWLQFSLTDQLVCDCMRTRTV